MVCTAILILVADEIAKILDPDGKLFTDRILSRDESGSFIVKSIHRLFPCNESMVVVVDDRADVWNSIPNLIQVRPCMRVFINYR
jgi:RNA polymerase II subunit A-like phosphatase